MLGLSDINSLSKYLTSYLTEEQINKVRRAYYYAEQAHDGQKRHSGEDYITHPLAVATILSKMRMDYQGLMAAMLHDVIEDSDITKDAITKQFGQTVADIVDGVSKLTHIRFEDKAKAQAENFQKMSLALAKDIRVILVKLADRTHNMRTLGAMPAYKRRIKAEETLEIYSPIAQRLGMHNMRIEFEDLGFAAMYPLREKLLKKAVGQVRCNRETIVNEVIKTIKKILDQNNIEASIASREKHLYSIYQKMKLERKPFSEIMDVCGIRIVTKSKDDCYRIIGLIHTLYKPFPGRFKDYIAIPKTNSYQSLHTTLFGAKGTPVEVQIRTEQMEEMAKNGIAAHWLYYEKDAALAVSQSQGWVKNLMELQKTSTTPLEFIEDVKTDLFPDEVYVFTPKGDILELPRGATAIDFAYAVHTDIGNTCTACRINKKLASLNEPLENGQTIEIIISENTRPRSTWLNFSVSSKARSNIRHHLKQQSKKESIELGTRLMNKVLMQIDAPIQNIDHISEVVLAALLKILKCETKDELLQNIGLGKVMAYFVTSHLMTLFGNDSTLINNSSTENQPLLIGGEEQNSIISFAPCCNPLPGDLITGNLKTGLGIVIHRQNCLNINTTDAEDELVATVDWDKHVNKEFVAKLLLTAERDKALFSSIANIADTLNAEVTDLTTQEINSEIRQHLLSLRVSSRIHLAKIMRSVRHLRCIHSISRHPKIKGSRSN